MGALGAVSGAAEGRDMSERVTWESCPSCGHRAAVGWTGDTVTEVDCARGCELTDEHVVEIGQPSGPPTGR